MEIKVVERRRLTDLVNPEHIVSVVAVSSHYGKSLAITVKEDISGLIGVRFVALDKFTYSVPSYVAIPRENYKDIFIMKKDVITSESERNTCYLPYRFYKCTITKRITW